MGREMGIGVQTNLATYRNVESFIGNSLSTVLHNYPYLLPYMKELSGFDKETFKHSICVAETAAKAFTKYAIEVGMPKDEFSKGVTTLSLGGFLHDIGKAGIKQYSMQDSLDALRPEENRSAIKGVLVSGMDTRSADERAVIHTHPTIGGYVVRNLCNKLPISKQIAEDVIDFAFSHHEKPADLIGTHNSYSRVSSLRKYPMDALLHTFLSLSDIAVSMREPRSYRGNTSLPLDLIVDELKTELSNGLLTLIFGPQKNLENIRNVFVNSFVMSSLIEIDSIVTQKDYDLEGYRFNGTEWHSTPMVKALLIPSIIEEVWAIPNYEKRFKQSLEDDGKQKWKHKSREYVALPKSGILLI